MKINRSDPHFMPVMESFYTIQGEGFHSGKPAYFIRVGGCDVGCHWCDVKESWDASLYDSVEVKTLAQKAKESGALITVITGGEPLMYNMRQLTAEVQRRGLKTHVETSGAYPLSGYWDWICFSPKKFKSPLGEFYNQSHELKVVVYNKSDLKWAQSHSIYVPKQTHLYLQPEWSRAKELTPLIVEFVKQHPEWKISLQLHKYMNIP